MRELKTTADELKDAFQIFDKQGTGMISVHDLKHSLHTAEPPVLAVAQRYEGSYRKRSAIDRR